MKRACTLFFFFLLSVFSLPLAAQIYVDDSATGDNTGASWEHAYTDLQDALTQAMSGDEIWIAEGTYKPDTTGGDPDQAFVLSKDLVILGGFKGDETTADQRDPDQYWTILSGDLDGDDIDDDFWTGKFTNAHTVLYINASVSEATVIDGIIIRNGYADGTGSSISQRNGGGICVFGSPVFRNVTFTQNYARERGGGLFLGSNSSVTLEDCYFHNNIANTGGGAATDFDTEFLVENCRFENNSTFNASFQANAGAFRIARSNGAIRGCEFNNNHAAEYGGAVMIWYPQGTNFNEVEVLDCSFVGNSAVENAGALSLPNFGYFGTYTLKGCQFIQNSAGRNGGAINAPLYQESNNAKLIIDSCSFSQNYALYNGGAILTNMSGNFVTVQILQSEFIENTADSASAALDLFATSNGSGSALVDGCLFDGNESFYSGALEAGNGWNGGANVSYDIRNSVFTNNTAMEGGALGLWANDNSFTNMLVTNCLIEGNTATIRGGGIGIYPISDKFTLTMDRLTLKGNSSPLGGAIDGYIWLLDSEIPENVTIRLSNSLVANNESETAAIHLDSIVHFNLLNTTVAHNESDGIHLSDRSQLILQNSILYNPEYTEFKDLTGDATYLSLGGNLYGDNSLGEALTHSHDQVETDPLFVSEVDFHLQDGSPAIDKGLPFEEVTTYDLDGNERLDCVDIGAYESDHDTMEECLTVGAGEVILTESIQLSPNPVTDWLQVQFSEAMPHALTFDLYNSQGQLIRQVQLTPGQELYVEGLPAGLYLLQAIEGAVLYTGKFIKE